MVDQAPNTTVTRSVVYETVTMYIPARALDEGNATSYTEEIGQVNGIARDIFMPPR
jgi:hypothetical protein